MSIPSYLDQKVKFAQIFNPNEKLPETEEELMKYFSILSSDLSPENLYCDGEISRAAAMKKKKEIMEAWKYLENKLGRKVLEHEAG